ncbi:hypothetical protein ES703_04123 [subsurface metagenome]
MLFRELWLTFQPYAINAKWFDPVTNAWVIIGLDHVMQEGGLYSVQVSQACTLTYNGVSIQLVEGWNEFVFRRGVDGDGLGGIWEWIKANPVIASAIVIGVYLVARGR